MPKILDWIGKKLGRAFEATGLKGIAGPEYILEKPRDYALFFSNLPTYFKSGAYLYLEDPSTRGRMGEILARYKESHPLRIAHDTIWPKTNGYHLPISELICAQLAEAQMNLAAPEVCAHLKVHDGAQLLVVWHDFPDNFLRVSTAVREEVVKRIAHDLQTSYKTNQDSE